jgi:hypothetical protein
MKEIKYMKNDSILIGDMVQILGEKYTLRIEQWRPEFTINGKKGAWRVGLNWETNGKHDFLCEYNSLKECLIRCLDYTKNA